MVWELLELPWKEKICLFLFCFSPGNVGMGPVLITCLDKINDRAGMGKGRVVNMEM